VSRLAFTSYFLDGLGLVRLNLTVAIYFIKCLLSSGFLFRLSRQRRGALKRTLQLGFLVVCTLSPLQAEAQALVAGASVVGILSGFDSAVSKLEQAASQLMDKGDIIAARQLGLVAEVLKGTISQLETSYKGAVNLTFERLDQNSQAVFREINNMLDDVDALETKVHKDFQQTILDTQTAVNQVLDRLPLVDKHPVVLGIMGNDLLNPNASVAQVIILGYHLAEPENGKQPAVTVDGMRISQNKIFSVYGRITVDLPDELGKKILTASNPCAAPAPYRVDITVIYTVPDAVLGVIPSKTEKTANFSEEVKPFATRYEVEAVGDFEGILEQPIEHRTFAVSSNSMPPTIDGDTHDFYAEYTCPAGATNIQSQMVPHFANVGAYHGFTSGTVGLKVTGTGHVEAHGRSFRDPAPSHTWGYFSLEGTYDLVVPHRTPVTGKQILKSVLSDNSVAAPVPGGLGGLTSLSITVKRLSCGDPFDTLSTILPDSFSGTLPLTSRNGFFKANISNQVIEVKSLIVQ
jgi:hypothetical protein